MSPVLHSAAGDLVVEYVGALLRPAVADRLEATLYNQLVGAGEARQACRPGDMHAGTHGLQGSLDNSQAAAAAAAEPCLALGRMPPLLHDTAPLLLPPPSSGTYIFRLNDDACVDATRAGNCAHLINHSCAPCCHSRTITVRCPASGQLADHVVIVASRDIAAGARARPRAWACWHGAPMLR